jgi:hypothetical protein
MNEIIPMEIINQKIFLIRREKVMFDVDLVVFRRILCSN